MMEISLPQQKLVKQFTIRTSSREQRDYHHDPNKFNRETRINCPSNNGSTTLIRYLQRLQIEALKLSKYYDPKVHLDKYAKGRTFLTDREFKALQWKVPNFVSNRLCISTDASTKGWGSTCQGISSGHRRNGRLTSTY